MMFVESQSTCQSGQKLDPSTVVAVAPGRTPRRNRVISHNFGRFSSLAEGLDYAAMGETGYNFYSARGQLEHVLPYHALRAQAVAMARKLLSLGLERGQRVAIVAETAPEFVRVFFGCQYAGLIACPMPYATTMGGRSSYIERITGMLKAADASVAVCSDDMRSAIEEAAASVSGVRVLTHGELESCADFAGPLVPFGAEDVAYIQYSSGSTSAPKGVLISQKAVLANARGMMHDGLHVTENDRAFSWLPLYHDMGLVGFCIAPMLCQLTIDYIATGTFARRPGLWLKLMSQNRTTITYAPSFGYDLASRRIGTEPLDLSALRVAGIGGDMVRVDVLNRFAETLEGAGFDGRAFLPSYGMAETTLAISFSSVDEHFRVDTVDRAACKIEGRAVPALADPLHPGRTRSFVVCGKPMSTLETQVRNDAGHRLADREIGHIVVRGSSLMNGYYRNPEATAAVVGADGFFSTGDMGYMLDGELVITGRAKDLILHNGRNIWPQDIEWAAERVDMVRDGDVAAFALEDDTGADAVVVLVQCRTSDPQDMDSMKRAVCTVVHQTAGVECRVVLVPPRSLPFTSSGKLSRAGARSMYQSGEILELDPAFAGSMPMAQELLVAAQ